MDPALSPAADGPPSPSPRPAGRARRTGAPAAGLAVSADLLALLTPAGVTARGGVLVGLLALSAVVSGAEAALRADEREGLAGDGGASPRRVRWLLDRPRQVLVALLIVRTTANVGAAVLAAHLTLDLAGRYGWSAALALGVQVLALAFVLLVGGESARRLAAGRRAAGFAKAAFGLLYPLVRGVYPLAAVLARVMDRRPPPGPPPAGTPPGGDLHAGAGIGEAHDALADEEAALIHSILEFGETTAREVMVSRVDMVALPVTATLDDALALIREAGHSRYPLYGADLDDILGVVYAKDLLPMAGPDRAPGRPVDWRRLARKARFIPPGRPLDALLEDVQAHRTHMAIVVDEYGGTLGLVTLEDLLEEVVGEIRDELDRPEDEVRVRAVGPDAYRVDGRVALDDLFEALGMEVGTEAFDFETLGGLVFHLTGAVPAPGHEVTFEGLRLRVEAVDENRIREVLVTRAPAPAPSEAGGAA